jgi:hypothetical protein
MAWVMDLMIVAIGLVTGTFRSVLRFLEKKRDYRGTSVRQMSNGATLFVDRTGREIALPHPARIALFSDGIETRFSKLLNEYCLDSGMLAGKTVIDVGANAGESE